MADGVQSQTNIKVFDIDINILANYWLVVLLDDQLICIIHFEMAGQKMVMVITNQLGINNFEKVGRLSKCSTLSILFQLFESSPACSFFTFVLLSSNSGSLNFMAIMPATKRFL